MGCPTTITYVWNPKCSPPLNPLPSAPGSMSSSGSDALCTHCCPLSVSQECFPRWDVFQEDQYHRWHRHVFRVGFRQQRGTHSVGYRIGLHKVVRRHHPRECRGAFLRIFCRSAGDLAASLRPHGMRRVPARSYPLVGARWPLTKRVDSALFKRRLPFVFAFRISWQPNDAKQTTKQHYACRAWAS